jgi:cysteinyl-tRNA synthetase
MIASLADNLNTPKLLGILFENLDKIKESDELKKITKAFLNQVLGLTLEPIEEEVQITPEIEELIQKREQARKEKNWELADQIREELKKLGFEVQDKKIK